MEIMKNILWGIPIGLVNGFFGSGGGVIAVLVLKKFFKLDEKKAHATALGIILPLSCASLFMYSEAKAEVHIVLLCALGGALGAVVGAKLLGKISKKWIKVGFGIVMVLSGVRMFL